jgi:MFS family permease/DNA-binding transcriptional ArsR family regulator
VITAEDKATNPSLAGRRREGDSGGTPPKTAVNRIALSRAITFSGGNAAFIALLFLLYRETNSASVVALGALASFAVPAIASPVAGWLGDRFDRRRVMVTSELFGSACFLLSAAMASSPAGLLVLRMLASLAGAPFMSATAAALPGIVRSREELPAANAKLAAAGLSGGLFGPLLAGGLIALSGPGSVFIFNAVTFLVSASLLVSIDAPFRPGRDHREKRRVTDLVAGFGVGLTAPAEVVLSTDFGTGAAGFAALTGAFASGGIAGARLAGQGLSRLSAEPITILAVASGVLTIGFLLIGFAPLFVVVLAGMVIAGAGCGTWSVAHEHLVQRNTPDDVRSRVFAGGEAVCQGGIAIGTIGGGGRHLPDRRGRCGPRLRAPGGDGGRHEDSPQGAHGSARKLPLFRADLKGCGDARDRRRIPTPGSRPADWLNVLGASGRRACTTAVRRRRPRPTAGIFLDGRARSTPTATVIPVSAGSPSREAVSRAKTSEILSALNHPLRRSILRLLFERGPASARQIAERISYVTESSVRSHLDVLAMHGMAKKEKQAGSNANVYSPTEEAPVGWVATVLILTAEED